VDGEEALTSAPESPPVPPFAPRLVQMQDGVYGESAFRIGLASSYNLMVRLVPIGH